MSVHWHTSTQRQKEKLWGAAGQGAGQADVNGLTHSCGVRWNSSTQHSTLNTQHPTTNRKVVMRNEPLRLWPNPCGARGLFGTNWTSPRVLEMLLWISTFFVISIGKMGILPFSEIGSLGFSVFPLWMIMVPCWLSIALSQSFAS